LERGYAQPSIPFEEEPHVLKFTTTVTLYSIYPIIIVYIVLYKQ